MNAAAYSLQKAIYAKLIADAPLKALIGDPPRLYDGVPDRPVFPFVSFGDWKSARLPGHDGLCEHDVRLRVHSRYEGRKETSDILVALADALHEAALILDAALLVSLRASHADIFFRQEPGAWSGALRLRAVTEDL